jgi:hypothetical protein
LLALGLNVVVALVVQAAAGATAREAIKADAA